MDMDIDQEPEKEREQEPVIISTEISTEQEPANANEPVSTAPVISVSKRVEQYLKSGFPKKTMANKLQFGNNAVKNSLKDDPEQDKGMQSPTTEVFQHSPSHGRSTYAPVTPERRAEIQKIRESRQSIFNSKTLARDIVRNVRPSVSPSRSRHDSMSLGRNANGNDLRYGRGRSRSPRPWGFRGKRDGTPFMKSIQDRIEKSRALQEIPSSVVTPTRNLSLERSPMKRSHDNLLSPKSPRKKNRLESPNKKVESESPTRQIQPESPTEQVEQEAPASRQLPKLKLRLRKTAKKLTALDVESKGLHVSDEVRNEKLARFGELSKSEAAEVLCREVGAVYEKQAELGSPVNRIDQAASDFICFSTDIGSVEAIEAAHLYLGLSDSGTESEPSKYESEEEGEIAKETEKLSRWVSDYEFYPVDGDPGPSQRRVTKKVEKGLEDDDNEAKPSNSDDNQAKPSSRVGVSCSNKILTWRIENNRALHYLVEQIESGPEGMDQTEFHWIDAEEMQDEAWEGHIATWKDEFPESAEQQLGIQQSFEDTVNPYPPGPYVIALKIDDDRHIWIIIPHPQDLGRTDMLKCSDLGEEWDDALERYFEKASVELNHEARVRELTRFNLLGSFQGLDLGKWKGKGRAFWNQGAGRGKWKGKDHVIGD